MYKNHLKLKTIKTILFQSMVKTIEWYFHSMIRIFPSADKMAFIVAYTLTILIMVITCCYGGPFNDKITATPPAVRKTPLLADAIDSIAKPPTAKSRSERSTRCEKKFNLITKYLPPPLVKMDGSSGLAHSICESCGNQIYGFVDGCYKIDTPIDTSSAKPNRCAKHNAIEVQIPVMKGCRC